MGDIAILPRGRAPFGQAVSLAEQIGAVRHLLLRRSVRDAEAVTLGRMTEAERLRRRDEFEAVLATLEQLAAELRCAGMEMFATSA